MIRTADNKWVEPDCLVWEIMYQYFNEEYSEAYPQCRSAIEVPEQYPVWKSKHRCQYRCDMLNKREHENIFENKTSVASKEENMQRCSPGFH